MTADLTLTILGCGSSGGVPRATGDWGACDPAEPKNRRRRCSLLVQGPGLTKDSAKDPAEGQGAGQGAATTVLIDAAPDFRDQMLEVGPPERIDAVFFTHTHADQAHGIDDLRAYVLKQRERLPVYALPETVESLSDRFGYCFESTMGYPPIMSATALDGPQKVGALTLDALPVEHGEMPGTAGYRIDGSNGRSAGYIPDANGLPEATAARLKGVDLLIIDALRPAPHPSHFSLQDALDWIERLSPGRAVLTNMHLDLDYRTLKAALPAGIEPAYDGMRLTP